MSSRIDEENCYYKVIKTIKNNNLIENGDKIVIGVSGGPDSICLLDILNKLRKNGCQKGKTFLATFDIVVAHVNHMIREEAKSDELYVKNFCEKNEIEFYSKSIDIKKIANTNKIGIEEAGRNARYEFFDEVLKKTNSNKIAIAHNKNDKIETIIMNVLRGCGLSGLKGIEAKRDIYIRPLIDCERDKIEEYCEKENLNPRIDKTNFENDYTRNKIRNIIIPYIKQEFNENIVETINRLSELVTEQDKYIKKKAIEVYKTIKLEENENQIILDLKDFNNQEKVIKSEVIIYTIIRLFGTSKGIEKVHIEDIIKLCSNNIGNKFLKPNKKIKILVKERKIYFIKLV